MGAWEWLTCWNTPFPICAILLNVVVLGQPLRFEIRRKNLTPHVPPFNVTLGHRNRHGSIGYLWLSITMGLSRTVSDISGENSKFSHPRAFNAPLRGFRWNLLKAVGLKKLGWCTCRMSQKCDDMSIRLETDRRTDGIVKTISRFACIACWCDKNDLNNFIYSLRQWKCEKWKMTTLKASHSTHNRLVLWSTIMKN